MPNGKRPSHGLRTVIQ